MVYLLQVRLSNRRCKVLIRTNEDGSDSWLFWPSSSSRLTLEGGSLHQLVRPLTQRKRQQQLLQKKTRTTPAREGCEDEDKKEGEEKAEDEDNEEKEDEDEDSGNSAGEGPEQDG